MNFFFRHPVYCTTNPRKAWSTVKAMRAYAKEHPVCEFTGRPGPIHVHHIEPIQFAPERAADPDNMVSLRAKSVHLVAGHAGNWKRYVANIRELCDQVSIGLRVELDSGERFG